MTKSRITLGVFCMIWFAVSCSTTRKLSSNETLYKSQRLTFEADNKNFKSKKYLGDLNYKPNTYSINLAGIKLFKLKLQNYYLFYKRNTQKKNLRTIGEPPSIFDSAKLSKSAKTLQQLLFNDGFFDNTLKYNTKTKHRKVRVQFLVNPGQQYKIHEVEYKSDNIEIQELLNNKYTFSGVVSEKKYYDESTINEEIRNIIITLKDYGYYNISSKNIDVEADTANYDHEVKLLFQISEDATKKIKTLERYTLDSIFVVEDKKKSPPIKTQNSLHHFSPPPQFNLKTLGFYIPITPSEMYSLSSIRKTYNRLNFLNTFEAVSVKHRISDSSKHKLNTYINLKKKNRFGYSIDFDAKRRTQNFGLASSLSFTSRNIFKSLSNLTIRGYGNIELQFSNPDERLVQTHSYGGNIGIKVPRFIFNPFNPENLYRRFNIFTEFKLGYDIFSRPTYLRNTLNFEYSYSFSSNKKNIKHKISLLDLEYSLINLEQEFEKLIEETGDKLAKETYSSVFTPSIEYTLFIMNQKKKNKNYSSLYFKLQNSGAVGGLLKLISEKNADGQYEAFSLPYSQFIRGELEIIKYLYVSKNNLFAFKLGLGVGKPYKNSKVLNVNNSFYISGSREVRAFLSRTLGPGSNTSEVSSLESIGEIKLVGNAEFRFDIIDKVKGAAFIDAGNIWFFDELENKPKANFEFDTFYKQLGVGIGWGIRYDLGYLVLLLDAATPIHNPSESFNKWSLNRRFVYNLGFNYPF